MRLIIFACVMTFALVFYIIMHRRTFGLPAAIILLGLVSIIYWLLASITSPPLPVGLLTTQAEQFEGVELTARARVSLGELSPSSQGAMLRT